jgi:hypothetical protein
MRTSKIICSLGKLSMKKPNASTVDTDFILKIQSALNQLGYEASEPDGVLGNKTIKAIKHLQVDNYMEVDGKPSYFGLEILMGKVG